MKHATVRKNLLGWYRRNRRDLPWRRTRDPYEIWISEAMLQQTRVETVIAYYQRFLELFPTVASLAEAESDDVLGAWAGLGYYSRARNLQKAAQAVVDQHGGRLPETADLLRELPGIGRYTAGAIASIAFDRPEPVVDGNVARVLTRLLDIRKDVKDPRVTARLWDEAAKLATGPDPGDFNQALMELGATVCTPKSPRCMDCPVSRSCAGLRAGDPEVLPIKTKQPAPKRIEAVAGLVMRRGKALAVRRPPRGLLGGLWELPGGELTAREKPQVGIQRTLQDRVGLSVPGAERVGAVEHAFTHRRLRLHVYRCEPPEGRVKLDGFDAHRWLSPRGLPNLPQSAVMRKALELLAES